MIKYGIYTNIFDEKIWVAFAFAKTTYIFIDIVLTRTVNILTTNELVKLKILWTAEPWFVMRTLFLMLLLILL